MSLYEDNVSKLCVCSSVSVSRFTGPNVFGGDLYPGPSGEQCLTFVPVVVFDLLSA